MDETNLDTQVLSTQRHPERRFISGMMLADRYRVVCFLGSGGMGEVYRAIDLLLEKNVALKFLTQTKEKDQTLQKYLINEVRFAQQVSHTNVCRVFDLVQYKGLMFITMEYIGSGDLASLLNLAGRLTAERAVRFAIEICQGLDAIHRKGILHLDLKPSNVMIASDGSVRLSDFGLAGIEGSVSAGAGPLRGTPAYMAPEQYDGSHISVRSDLYSLGLVLYLMVTGRPAFVGNSWEELARCHRGTTPRPPSLLVNDVDPSLEAAILWCLQKPPEQRPASARDVISVIRGLQC